MDTKKKLRIFQVLTIVLTVALLFIIHNQLNSEFTYDRTVKRKVDEAFLDKRNLNLDTGNPNPLKIGGSIVPSAECKKKYETFLNRKKKDIFYTVDKQTHGYFFSIESFLQFSAMVDSIYQSNPTGIEGIRVYKCVNEIKGERYYDTFIVPQRYAQVKSGGSASLLEAVDDFNFALNTSWPCPDMCEPTL